MVNIKSICKGLIQHRCFEWFIVLIILLNSALIIASTYQNLPIYDTIQHICLGIFAVEIVVRFMASDSVKTFFQSGWHIFDLFLIVTGLLPEAWFSGSSGLLVLRILRILRVLRLVRTSSELKLILAVLMKSFRTLAYNGMFFCIFFVMFATLGVSLFRLGEITPQNSENHQKYIEALAPITHGDPYGNVHESMFTLFRVMTGDDWTLVCYNLEAASRNGLIHASPVLIRGFHVCWFVLAAFLLLNLLVGAIVNNYQILMEEVKTKKDADKKAEMP